MPYITSYLKSKIDPDVDKLIDTISHLHCGVLVETAGVFTYVVCRLLKFFYCRNYWSRALGIGCLVMAILEIYRREHAPYEDEKIREKGDVT